VSEGENEMSKYDDERMSTGAWFWTLLILAIPGLNLIMYVIWALGVGNRNRVTFCRASILWTLIAIVGYAVFLALSGVGLAQLGNGWQVPATRSF
jgi:fatty acid desaturase